MPPGAAARTIGRGWRWSPPKPSPARRLMSALSPNRRCRPTATLRRWRLSRCASTAPRSSEGIGCASAREASRFPMLCASSVRALRGSRRGNGSSRRRARTLALGHASAGGITCTSRCCRERSRRRFGRRVWPSRRAVTRSVSAVTPATAQSPVLAAAQARGQPFSCAAWWNGRDRAVAGLARLARTRLAKQLFPGTVWRASYVPPTGAKAG
jgi:hypothetical protein